MKFGCLTREYAGPRRFCTDRVAHSVTLAPRSGERVPSAPGARRVRGITCDKNRPSPGSHLRCSPPSPPLGGEGYGVRGTRAESDRTTSALDERKEGTAEGS